MNPFILVHAQAHDGKGNDDMRPILLNVNHVAAFVPQGSGGDAEPVLALLAALDENGDPMQWQLAEDLGFIEHILDSLAL